MLFRPVAPPFRCPFVPFPQRQQIPRFGAVAESHSAWPLATGSHHTPPPSTFRRCAEFPCFRLTFRRCAEASLLRERPVSVFLLPPCISHLPKVCRIPVFSSHLPKVRGVVTASRTPCVRVSPAAVAFPPSEGVQNSRVFVPPSEGARSRHCFESALCPCFSCRRGIPTFRRCAEYPCFCPTFRRCAESSLLREHPVSVFFLPPCVSHLPKVRRIPVFSSHLPKVRGVVTASRATCVRVSPAAVRFPPSEGVQYSHVFVSPSEGVQFQNEKAGCALS